jgi:hypothetical protein
VAPKKDKRVWRELAFESGGRKFEGSYAVARRMVDVRSHSIFNRASIRQYHMNDSRAA